jgi:hypothetical protein
VRKKTYPLARKRPRDTTALWNNGFDMSCGCKSRDTAPQKALAIEERLRTFLLRRSQSMHWFVMSLYAALVLLAILGLGLRIFSSRS